MNRIEAVFLDVGGVFHLPLHDPIAEALTSGGIEFDPARLDDGHFAGVAAIRRREMEQWKEGEWLDPAAVAYLTGYSKEIGIADRVVGKAIEVLAQVFEKPRLWARIIPGSLDALRAIAATGVKVGIVSNSDGTLEERLLQEGICQVGEGPGVPVGVICDSMAVGVSKPDPKIFEIALEALGVPAAAAIHVGDTVEADVVGAVAAGVRPIHIDPLGLCEDGSHRHIAALGEVVAMMGG